VPEDEENRQQQHLLEVGCGMGHEIRRLAGRVAPGGSVLGIGMNHAMIDEARRRTADLGGTVRCQVGDVQRLELGDAVDGVRTERVLMYVPDQQRAISELARVVRLGGRVVAFELDYGATLVDLPDRGAAQRVLDVLADTVAHRWTGRTPGPGVSPGRAAGHRRRTAPHRAAARDLPPARRAGLGRRGRDGDTRGSRLPALAGGGAGRRARRLSQRHVRRDGRLSPQA
jgi:SAM-dependent methyltransferase